MLSITVTPDRYNQVLHFSKMSSSRAYYAISPASAAAARDVCYNSVASLTLLVWHFFVTLDDEVQYIWTMRNMNQFKWLYFLLRYPVILAHVTHNSFIERLANGSNPPLLCGIWYNYAWAFPQFLGTLLELILALRIFAFYNRSKKVAFLLSTVILMEAAGTARSISLQQTAGFYGTCLLLPLTRNATYQTILALIVHCTLIGLTLFKYLLASRAGWGKSPLVALVVRHGTIVYTITLFFFVSEVIMHDSESERGAALVLFVIIVCIVYLGMTKTGFVNVFSGSWHRI
ncbi:hypothetical protein JVT61DRAFT_4696 [Boletus reticuloceps]|uniref:DUF6533 domain-containing protein n=1 Tax=Boletus reticuloceps TaxID=495285 RepID=A0A8I3A712_9AGAM|nr:hypothetical protein JVT61DRAFT_4696 [Boletus reticuloceps]